MSSTAARAGAQPRTRTTPRWWAELSLIALVYVAYSAGRLFVAGGTGSAVAHGNATLDWEQALHIDPEHTLNSLFSSLPWLGVPACLCYATLHYVVTPSLLVWLWRRHPRHYLFMRTWLMTATLIGLIGFLLLPTAPPRLLPMTTGFHDTMAQYAGYGWWGTDASAPEGFGGLTNQYAAMPSLHVGWAIWCGVMLWRYGRSPLIRVAGVAYPAVITVVVLGTANHYLLDTAAGAAVIGVALLLTPWLRRGVARLQSAWPDGRAGADAPAGDVLTAPPAVASRLTLPAPRRAEMPDRASEVTRPASR